MDKNSYGISYGKISIQDCFYGLIFLFPFSTLLQGIIGSINTILFVLLTLCMVFLLFQNLHTKSDVMIVFIVVLSHIYAIFCTDFSAVNNTNTIFYFMFWVLYALYIREDYDGFKDYVISYESYICNTLRLSCLLMAFSALLGSSYSEGSFVAFSGSSHRVCSVAIFMMAIILVIMNVYGKKNYILWSLIPMYAVFMGEARTYLLVGVLEFLVLMWYYFDDRKNFYLSLIPIGVILIIVALNSSISDKLIASLDPSTNQYTDALGVLTSGRSVFWKEMLTAWWNTGGVHILFGDGFHFVYTIRKFWAHNDFIQLLLTFGVTGCVTYLICTNKLIRFFFRERNIPPFIVVCIYIIWAFNAFFNMFYTYICASLSFPILLLAVSLGNEKYHDLEC